MNNTISDDDLLNRNLEFVKKEIMGFHRSLTIELHLLYRVGNLNPFYDIQQFIA